MIKKSSGTADRNGRRSGQGRAYQLDLLPADELREHIARLESAINNMSEGLVMFDAAKPEAGKLYFTEAEWDAFVLGVKDGEFDLDEDGNLPPVPADQRTQSQP